MVSEMSTGYLTILFVESDIKPAICSKPGVKDAAFCTVSLD